MKKFFVSVIILAVFGGFIFFFGWIQFYVPNGSVGVMTSKTGGVDPVPVQPGQFRWAWERLLPTNCEILVFTAKPWEGSLSKSGELPSAEFYSRFLNGTPDFSWKISAKVSVKPRAEELHVLVDKYAVKSDAEMEPFIASETERAFTAAAEKLLAECAAAAAAGNAGKKLTPDSSFLADYLGREIAPELEVLSVSVTDFSIPDFNLYAEGAAAYSSYSAKHREMAEAVALRSAEEDLNDKEQMRRFAQWGSFLEKFPSLVDFLAVARDDAAETLEVLKSLKAETGE